MWVLPPFCSQNSRKLGQRPNVVHHFSIDECAIEFVPVLDQRAVTGLVALKLHIYLQCHWRCGEDWVLENNAPGLRCGWVLAAVGPGLIGPGLGRQTENGCLENKVIFEIHALLYWRLDLAAKCQKFPNSP
ncbi:hypothetical protein BaRGS_00013644 [Batillaria attramentaria]|uniref:Uncharacterized protein n=1 Tax=Batillaria attramentaria TaxID=370345 RepID=A0ABD0L6M3_9CAEN